MKLLTLLITFACLNLAAAGYAQKISLSVQDAPLQKIFKLIERQTDFRFVYTKEQLQNLSHVSLNVKSVTLENVLDECLKEQPLSYTVEDNMIVIQKKLEEKVSHPFLDVSGKVTNSDGQPLAGITVTVKSSGKATVTGAIGEFLLTDVGVDDILMFSGAETETREVKINGNKFISVTLSQKVNELDETMVIAYGKTTRRLSTGNVTKVTGEIITKQPVANPIAALAGRVPGLIVTETSGLNGSALKVQIRGQNSIAQGSEPFYLVDGVPFVAGFGNLNGLTNATDLSGLSPFNLLNPADIESIEILKDADATTIYGSRGANGVILITTKKGKAGKTNVSLESSYGWSTVTRTMDILNTKQYLEMRREAFVNDGIIPTVSNAPDLLLWDTTRYTNFKKALIGETATMSNTQVSVSGGSNGTTFRLSAGYNRQTTVFPGKLADQRGSVHFAGTHQSTDAKLNLNFSVGYVYDHNTLPGVDLTSRIFLPPHLILRDANGNLKWDQDGVNFNSAIGVNANPLAFLFETFNGTYQNLFSNLTAGYFILPNFNLRLKAGYNAVNGDENKLSPSTSLDLHSFNTPSAMFSTHQQKSWILEPQLEFTELVGKGRINILGGATWQENTGKAVNLQGTNYSSDILLESIAGAGSVLTQQTYSRYRYMAVFGRINYQLHDKYLLNLSGRRDGSSRFGPASRFSNFGAVGAGWIFSKEKWFSQNLSTFSFGKIRASYGVTGNDQVGDYKFVDTWRASSNTYQGGNVLEPTALFNASLEWEKNKKWEVGLDAGLLRDRILISLVYFSNKSSNQLISYTLPIQTGFTSVNKNLDAEISNKGFELQVTSKNIVTGNLKWITSLNLTFPRNKLISFPGLATSSYSYFYRIGQPLSGRMVYNYTGVDPLTGIYMIEDVNRDGMYNQQDRIIPVHTDPKFYGGLSNTFSFKGLELELFLEFRKQTGQNYIRDITGSVPGIGIKNQPAIVLDRWRNPGDQSKVQKFISSSGNPAFAMAAFELPSSDALYSDASFIRCKNISLSYTVPSMIFKKMKIEGCQIYLRAQNVFVITNYEGNDPETQNLRALPPLKTIAAGIRLNF